MSRTVSVCFTDAHIPFHNPDVMEVIKKVIQTVKPDYSASLGDLLDCSQFSAHEPTYGMPETEYESDLEYGKEFLDDIQKHTKQRLIIVEGNHCLSRDTEVLTDNGFKNITAVSEQDNVGQFDIATNEISFARPTSLTQVYAEHLYNIESGYMRQTVTDKHDVVYNGKKIKAEDLAKIEKIDARGIPFSGILKRNPANITDNWIRLLTWVIMDGTVVDHAKYVKDSIKIRVQFKLSREDKIEKLCKLLDDMEIQYTVKKATMCATNVKQPYYIRIYGDSAREIWKNLDYKKVFPKHFMRLDTEQVKTLLETIAETDGGKRWDGYFWSSISQENVELVSYLCTISGFAHKFDRKVRNNGFKNGKDITHFTYFLKNCPTKLLGVQISKVLYNDVAYCMTMPAGTLVTRNNGKIAFTGNCNRIDRWAAKTKEGRALYNMISPRIQLMKTSTGKSRTKATYIPYGSVDGKYPHYKLNNRVVLIHGWSYNKAVTQAHLASSQGKSIILGHCHRMQSQVIQNVWGEGTVQCHSIGCLCNKIPLYGVGNPVEWVNGFSIGFHGSHSDTIYPITIVKGSCVLPDGREIKI